MVRAVLLAAVAQALQLPPAPPPAAVVGDALQRDVDSFAGRLRRACMSEAGIRIAADDLVSWRRERAGVSGQQERLQEIGETALTTPIDIDRLERLQKIERDYQATWMAARDARSIALLRRLSPADRAIYARDLTIMQPVIPLRTCSATPRLR